MPKRRDLGYLDLATPRTKYENPKAQHAEVTLRRMNLLVTKSQDLSDRIHKINNNDKLSDEDKAKNSAGLKIEIEKNIAEMRKAINDERLVVYEEFRRIRKLNPDIPLDDHPELKALKAASEKLAAFAETLKNTQELIYAPKAERDDPWLRSMPLVPTDKPVMTKEHADAFVKTAIKEGWVQASKDIKEYAKANKVREVEVKNQVINLLLERRYKQAMGDKPRDMSKEPEPPEAKGPSMRR